MAAEIGDGGFHRAARRRARLPPTCASAWRRRRRRRAPCPCSASPGPRSRHWTRCGSSRRSAPRSRRRRRWRSAAISCMRWVMRRIDSTALAVELCTARICPTIASVALAVCTASDLTSDATTAKPRPASPARAASIVALSARRLVCSAMVWMSLTMSPIFCADSASVVHFSVGGLRFVDRHAHDVVGLRDLPRDLGNGTRQFVGGARRRLHSGRGLVRGFDRALRALRGVIGGGGKRDGGRFHRRGAVAECLEQRLHLGAERRNRRIDGAAPPLLVGGVIVLLLQTHAIGHIFVGRNPAAVRHRLVGGIERAAICPLGRVHFNVLPAATPSRISL